MSLILYNTFSKREEEFTSLEPGVVRMYTCGPTVYGRPHIGNYSAFLMADLLRRWLEVKGYKVVSVKNITDVGHLVADSDEGEDKIEKQAKAEKIDPLSVARKYTEQYLEDERALGMLEPAHRPLATETVPEMLTIIKELIKKEHAYETEDGIYFDVRSFPQYGALSGNTLENLDAGARVAVKEHKRHPADFALWKKCVGQNGHHLLRWNFVTGERVEGESDDASVGFPGWHIECSAMSMKFLGPQLDIHTGGEDNIFPHHECEIAQSECANQKKFVRTWLHKRRIDLAGEKMSKSLGNVLEIPGIVAKGYDALDIRYYLLSVHYRTNLKFSWKGMDDSKIARRKIIEWMSEVDADTETLDADMLGTQEARAFLDAFTAAMNADLNTSGALAALFDAMSWYRRTRPLSVPAIEALRALISMARHTFGCFDAVQTAKIPAAVQALIDERDAARAAKDFAASDRLRDAIAAHGYMVKDTAEGQKITKM